MLDYRLRAAEIDALRAAHRGAREKRVADRIKAVVLLATGWSAEQVAEVLQVDPNTVRNHFRRYQAGGVEALRNAAYRGSTCELSDAELAILDAHLQKHLYPTAKAVANWVEETFEVRQLTCSLANQRSRIGLVNPSPWS